MAILSGALAANGTTYYVSQTGSDANPGTATAPFLTVQRGVDAALAGDTVVVKNGTYQPPPAAGCTGGNGFAVNIAKAGTSAAWITVKAETRGGATLNGAACHSTINLGVGAAYVSLEGLVVTGGYWGGIWSNQNAHDIRISANRIEYVGNRYETSPYGIAGLYTNSTSNNFTIEKNTVHHIGRTSGSYMWHDHGMYVHGSNYAIVNNLFYSNTSGWAITPVGPLNNVLIANNTFAFPNPIRDGHIAVGDGSISNLTIRNNIFYQPAGAAVVNCVVSYSGANSFDNNVVYGATQLMGGDICGGGTTGLGTIAQSGNRVTDPQLVNASAAPYDFRLKTASPAINTGVTVAGVTADLDGTARPQGAAYDVGAYEYVSGTVTQPPVISAVAATGITYNSATITWTTDAAADSQVQYGIGGTTLSTALDAALVTSHRVALAGLAASTTYSYKAISKNSGGTAQSSVLTFTTPAAPVAPFSFSLSASPASLSVQRGLAASATIGATLVSGSAQAVTFSAAGLPAGVSAAFSPASCTVNCTTTLTLATTALAPTGTLAVTVNASGGGASASAGVSLTIVDVNPATYYVAPTGSDSNPGSATLPFLTLQRGVDAAKAGDTIVVRDGTYGPPAAGCTGGSGFAANIDKAGTAAAWITLKSETKRGATLDGQNACHSYINLGVNAAYWVIQDFRITQGYWSAIWSNNGASNITVRGNEMAYIGRRTENSQYGIVGSYANSKSTNLVFDGNLIHDVGRTASTYSMTEDQGLYVSSANTTIVNNVFHQPISGWGVQTTAGFSGLIANNTFHGANPAREGQIHLSGASGAVAVRNNIFNASRTQAIASTSFTSTACAVSNNGVSGSGVALGAPAACTTASNLLNTDPQLVNTASLPYDFHLKGTSPVIDKGAAVAEAAKDADAVARPQGAAYDAGAFEYTGPAAVPPVISAVTAVNVTSSAATITWTTDQLSDSQVQYGVGGTTTSTPVDGNLVTSHSVSLSGLTASTTYTYKAVSKNSAGDSATSASYTFTTPAAPAVFSFSLAASPAAVTVTRGLSVTTKVTAALLSGSGQSVAFRAANLPAGVTAGFSPSSCTVTCSTTLTLTTASTALAGSYGVAVSAGTTVTAATTVALTISDPSNDVWGLAAQWPLTEGKGLIAYDSSTNKNNGNLLGGVTWYKTRSLMAAQFSGTGIDFIQVSEAPSLQMTTAMSVAFWISPDDVAGVDERVLAKVYSWDIKLQGDGRYPQLTAGGKYAQLNYPLAKSVWQHVVFTFSKGQVKGYVNGTPVGLRASSFTGGETLPQQYYGLVMGADADKAAPMKGRLGDVRLFGRALSDAEAAGIFSQGRYKYK